ncbi:MAG: nitrate/nitrite transporter NrtS [Agarilytica sp.]
MSNTRSIQIRAIKIALIVGSILACINYGDKMYLGEMNTLDWTKLFATYVVPYCVSLYSGLLAQKQS